jgi:hypothetical protein
MVAAIERPTGVNRTLDVRLTPVIHARVSFAAQFARRNSADCGLSCPSSNSKASCSISSSTSRFGGSQRRVILQLAISRSSRSISRQRCSISFRRCSFILFGDWNQQGQHQPDPRPRQNESRYQDGEGENNRANRRGHRTYQVTGPRIIDVIWPFGPMGTHSISCLGCPVFAFEISSTHS